MKTGMVFDIKRYAIHDGPGIRTTIFLKGCPAKCWWCHNPESQSPEPEQITKKNIINGREFITEEPVGKLMSVNDVIGEIKKDIIFADESGGGVTFSGGEPLMQHEFLFELLKACQSLQIHIALDTTGYADQNVFSKLLPYIDIYLFDLKIMDNGYHQIYTGVSNKNILRNLDMLVESRKEVILRFPMIPGYTDTSENIGHIKAFLSTRAQVLNKIDILPFHNLAGDKYNRLCKPDKFSHFSRPSVKSIDLLKSEFESLGLFVGIGG